MKKFIVATLLLFIVGCSTIKTEALEETITFSKSEFQDLQEAVAGILYQRNQLYAIALKLKEENEKLKKGKCNI